jgi:hypothetical protein
MIIAKLALLFAVVSAASFAAGSFLTRYLVDHHYVALSPLRPESPIFPGSSGAIRSHWALLNTVRIKADLHFSALNQSFRSA